MTHGFSSGMAEATRLTGAGKLAEATVLIQRLLQNQGTPGAAGGGSSLIIDGEPVLRTTAPPSSGQPASGFAGRLHARPRMGLGETLRGLSGRGWPADPGIGGVARPAPDPLPDGASFAASSYTGAAGTRAYKLYVPSSGAGGGQSLPLIVMLHGCTQSPDDFAAGTRMNALAEEQRCLVLYPAQPASANSRKCWNWFSPTDQRRDQGEPSLIAGITRQVMDDHPVDPSRIYIAGLSAGGAAAVIMGAAYPDLYAAVGVHSGLPSGAARDIPSAFAAMRQGAENSHPHSDLIPTIVFHGDRDAIVHPCNGDAVVAQSMASASGLRLTVRQGQVPGGHAYRREIHSDSSGRALCEHWTIHGAGHAWGGGSPSGSYTDPQGPDATREMARFFFEHRNSVSHRRQG